MPDGQPIPNPVLPQTPQDGASASTHWLGKFSISQTGIKQRGRVMLDPNMCRQAGFNLIDTRVKVERQDTGLFHITAQGLGQSFAKHGQMWALQISRTITEGLPVPCPTVPTECLIVDGAIVVEVKLPAELPEHAPAPRAQRRSTAEIAEDLAGRPFMVGPTPGAVVEKLVERLSRGQQLAVARDIIELDATNPDTMRAVAEMVAIIERATKLYTLKHMADGTLKWRAPEI